MNMTTGETAKHGIGRVFGALEYFNNTNHRKDVSASVVPQSVHLYRGSIFRFSYTDYNDKCMYHAQKVLPIKKWIEEDEDDPSDEEGLTADDLEIIRIRKLSRKCMSKTLFRVLLRHKISPKLNKDPGREYIHRGELGRKIIFNEKDQSMIYFVVEGAMKFQIERLKTDVNVQHVVLTKKGDTKTMDIKVGKKSRQYYLFDFFLNLESLYLELIWGFISHWYLP